MHVEKALDVMALHNTTHNLLFTGRQEIIFVSTQKPTEKPELCHVSNFEEASNAIPVPRSPVLGQRSPPIRNPGYIRSVLNKTTMVPDPYIAQLLTTYQRQSVIDEIKTISGGNDGTNTKITRNSYAIALGRGGCADATWKCSNHATQYIVDRVSYLFRDYPGAWSVTTSSFRPDMCHNVVLDVLGYAEPQKFVLTGSHLDSRNTGSGPTATGIAPGADDNGTGSGVNLVIARLIAENKIRFAYSVRIMWFCGEEQGLLGSDALAKLYAREGVDIQAMFNMDMIGYTDAAAGVTLSFDRDRATLWLTDSCKEISRTYLPNLPVGTTTACCSDQQSFFNAGFPTTGIFETPTNRVVYPRYHQVGDQWDNGFINYDQVWQFGKAMSACVLEYAVPLP